MSHDTEQCLYFTGGRRLSAATLDLLPCFALAWLASSLSEDATLVALLPLLIYTAYASTLQALGGTTFGKLVMGLRSVDFQHRSQPTARQILLRETLTGLSYTAVLGPRLVGVEAMPGWLLLICCLFLLVELGFMIVHPAGRCLHDLAAGTCVLHHPDPRLPRPLRRYAKMRALTR